MLPNDVERLKDEQW